MSEQNIGSRSEMYQKYRGLEKQAQELDRTDGILENEAGELVDDIQRMLAEVNAAPNGDKERQEETEKKMTKSEREEIQDQLRAIQEQMSMEQIAEEENKAWGQLLKFGRERRRLIKLKQKLETAIHQLIQKVHRNSTLRESSAVWSQITGFEAETSKIDVQIETVAKENPVAFQAYWLMKIREWKKSFDKHGIIETDGIKEQTQNVMHDARRKLEGTNGVVTLLGPTGSGKTVLARKIAETFSPDGKYEFVSAHSKMTPFDLISRMGIVVEQIDPSDVLKNIKEVQARFLIENPDLSVEDRESNFKTIKDVLEGRAQAKAFETKSILEAVGRAQKEGRIVVIDEFNYLPPETLASLNDILANKNNPPGFGVVFTGNIGEEYKRNKPDPAFINRVLSGTVSYQLPGQELDQALDASIASTDALEAGAQTSDRDLYQIVMTQLIDKKGNLLAPPDTLQKVWDFVRICSLTQQLAQGKDFRGLGLSAPPGGSAYSFKTVFLSFRNINQVVREWKLGGFRQPLEWHVYDAIIRPAAVYAPKEAAQLMHLFKDWGGMFVQETWKDIQVDSTQWRIAGLDHVMQPEDSNQTLKAFQPAEFVEAVSGYRLPVEQSVEEAGERKETQEYENRLAKLEHDYNEQVKEYLKEEFALIEKLCAMRIEAGLDQAEDNASDT